MIEHNNTDSNWAVDALTKVLTESLKEQRKTRRWKTLGRLFTLIIMLFILGSMIATFKNGHDLIKLDTNKPHTALISIKNIISEDNVYANSEKVIKALNDAYEQKNVRGIILDLNSPGGSPVQSDLIYNEIVKLQKEDKDKRKVYAVMSDLCASGCYYIAAAADQIYANEASLVGSIGVISQQFGMVDLMKKIGVENRTQTAGDNKAILNPFSPMTEEAKIILQKHLDIIHNIFIDKVKQGRGKRLKTNNPDIFSGLFWTGSQAKTLGLVDDFKSKDSVAKDIIKAENIIDYSYKPNLGDLLLDSSPGVQSAAKSSIVTNIILKLLGINLANSDNAANYQSMLI